MNDETFPKHYESWKICITKKCKITLTKEFIENRISILTDENSTERKKFIKHYGLHWTNTIISYFKQSLNNI
jgi:hypothetical protein